MCVYVCILLMMAEIAFVELKCVALYKNRLNLNCFKCETRLLSERCTLFTCGVYSTCIHFCLFFFFFDNILRVGACVSVCVHVLCAWQCE